MKTKTLIFKLNEDLKSKFKSACALNQETQQDAVNKLIKHYVDTNGKLQEQK